MNIVSVSTIILYCFAFRISVHFCFAQHLPSIVCCVFTLYYSSRRPEQI